MGARSHMWLKVFKSFLELGKITTPHEVCAAPRAFPAATDVLPRGETDARWLRGRKKRAKGGKKRGHEKKKPSSRILNLLPWSQRAAVGCLARLLTAVVD